MSAAGGLAGGHQMQTGLAANGVLGDVALNPHSAGAVRVIGVNRVNSGNDSDVMTGIDD